MIDDRTLPLTAKYISSMTRASELPPPIHPERWHQKNNMKRIRRRTTSISITTTLIAASAALAILHTPTSTATSSIVSSAGAVGGGFDSQASDDGDGLSSNSSNASGSSNAKTVFRVFQTLPREPSSMSPREMAQMYRTIRATQAMVFSPSQAQNNDNNSNNVDGEKRDNNNNNNNNNSFDDNVELVLDIYSPSERREYLVKRGNRCHPRSSSSGGGSDSDGNRAFHAPNIDIHEDDDNKSLQWYDVLSRYDSLMLAAASKSSHDNKTAFHDEDVSKQSTSSGTGAASGFDLLNNMIHSTSSSAELERAAIELFKFCVLYNSDGHAYWGWDEQLLLPFRDVVNVEGNYGVIARSDVSTKDRGAKEHANEKDTASLISTTVNGENSKDTTSDLPSPTEDANAGFGSGNSSTSGGISQNYIHESFLSISPYTPATSELSAMIRLLLETSDDTLASDPLFLPRELHRLIAVKQYQDSNSDNIGNNAAVVAAAAAAAESVAGDNNDGSNDGDKNNGAIWTLLNSNCIPLADPSHSSSNNSEMISSSTSVVVDSSSSLQFLELGVQRLEKLKSRMAESCSLSDGGYCCLAFSSDKSKVSGNAVHSEKNLKDDTLQVVKPAMALRHPVVGWTSTLEMSGQNVNGRTMPYKNNMQPDTTTSNSKLGGIPEMDMPYVATVRLVMNNTSDILPGRATNFPTHSADAPNFFDILFENDCLPYRKECHRCLKDEANEISDPKELTIANACSKCQLECPCYCDILCKVRPPPKPITRAYVVQPPQYRKDPERLVPKIIHQTWFEPVEREKYPNMSRLIESWKKSGWEYYFYDDDTAGDFLDTHFPPEVREAYESITPGAFKADLFRYCVLLIRGGVYADMDVLLQTNLDDAIANDVGFMTPIDQPGIGVGHRSCLWNGLIASAPAHPFLARTIEIVVNNIRNRFTAVDYDDMLCPNPILSVVHTVDTLFTCGPCILGAGINNLMGLHMQTQFEVGDIDIWQRERSLSKDGPNGMSIRRDDQRLLVPGRTIILEQNKNDMGAHRFTWADRHLIVAATDMPDYDDRPPTKEHYSKTHEKAGVYGLRKLYTDTKRANEEIRIVIGKL